MSCLAFYYMLVVSSGSEPAVADSLRMLEGFTEMMRQFPVYIFGREDFTADECLLFMPVICVAKDRKSVV